MPLSWRSAAAIAVLAALVLASMQPSAAAPPATRRPNPLERFRSWDEAWAALSPYARSSPKNAFCGSGPTVAAACGESSILSLWKAWKLAYRKKDDKRYGYFRTNVVKIARALQTCPKALWPKLTNNYMDWSAAELARHNIKMWVPPTKPDELIGPKSGPPQSSWDWRKLGKVTPAKDQGRCGSCYAFAAAGAIESKLLIQFNKTTKDYLVDLSEQQLVDCANAKAGRSLTGGCDGGNV